MPIARLTLAVFAITSLLISSGTVFAHDPALHKALPATTAPLPAKHTAKQHSGLPFDRIGGPFTLTDHYGNPRTDTDFHGRFLLIFFGYANCESICPIGLQRMTEALDALETDSEKVQPVLVTVDPENDTPAALAQQMPKIHPRLVGLTGSPEQVQAVMRTFQVESKQVSQAGDGAPIYAHGSFIYLMRPDGKFATLIPPVLGVDQMAEIMRRYVN